MMTIHDLVIDTSQALEIDKDGLKCAGQEYTITHVNQCIKKMISESKLIQIGRWITYSSMATELQQYSEDKRFEMALNLK